ncbi:hypothetical protein [Siphonobacter sp. BAB-5385]|uniref:hypothetical protein n=1 Tax=Siphonobacter sp. BAB-5385 TaxID=1864822 RepID=UPI0026C6CF15
MKGELKPKPRVFHSISDLHRTFGLPQPSHPLISLLEYSKVQLTAAMLTPTFLMDFYHITFNASAGCSMRYGQTTYDFDEGDSFHGTGAAPVRR